MRVTRWICDDRGQDMVELAIVAPLLILLFTGIYALGYFAYYAIEVSNAAHAGAIYGMQSSTSAIDTSDIVLSAQKEVPEKSITVTPSYYYVCLDALNGTTYGTTTDAAASCANYQMMVRVQTSLALATPVSVPGLPDSITLSGNSVMEVQN